MLVLVLWKPQVADLLDTFMLKSVDPQVFIDLSGC